MFIIDISNVHNIFSLVYGICTVSPTLGSLMFIIDVSKCI